MSIKLKGSSDGSVSFDAPADTSPSGSDITLVLPTTVGSAEQFLKNSGTAGTLEFSSMVETSTGVGIGTSSPGEKLTVAGKIQATTEFKSESGNDLRLNAGSANRDVFMQVNGSTLMTIQGSTGRVGIGTSSPNGLLTVQANSGRLLTFRNSTTGTGSSDGSYIALNGSDLQISNAESANTIFYTGDSERLRINSSGQVGIGETSPDRLLHLKNTSDTAQAKIETTASSGRAQIQYKSPHGDWVQGIQGATTSGDFLTYTAGSKNIIWYTSNSERMRLDSSGRVGLGTSSPTALLHLNATSPVLRLTGSSVGNCEIQEDGSTLMINVDSSNAKSSSALVFRTDNVERMRIDSLGKLLVAKASSGGSASGVEIYEESSALGRIDVYKTNSGTANALACFHSGSYVGGVQYANSSTSFQTSSDARLKENISNIDGAITRIKQLSPKRFNFIIEPSVIVDGFLAHEAQTVVPEAVSGTHNEVDADGNPVYQGIDQSKLVPLLTAALKEAIAKIETLETKVAALEAQ